MKELTWGDWLRLWRRARGWSRAELGRRAGVHVSLVKRYEIGRRLAEPRTLYRLAGALELDVTDLAPLPLLRTSRRISRADRSPAAPRPAHRAGRRRGGARPGPAHRRDGT